MKLSIITINYNDLEGLRKTAESVINQTWRDFEWIIVDGGSTDGSAEYIQQLAVELAQGKDQPAPWEVEHFSLLGFSASDLNTSQITHHTSRVTNHASQSLLWCSEKDSGIYNAMNKGIMMSSGEYLLFLNSGDVFSCPEILSKIPVNDFNRDFEICHLFDSVSSDIDNKTIELNKRVISIDTLMASPLPQPSTFIKHDLFDNVGLFDESMRICSDLKFFIEAIVFHSATYKYLPIALTVFDTNGISSSFSELHINERNQLRSMYFPERVQQDYIRYRDLEAYWEVIRKNKFLGLLLKILHRLAIILD